MNVIKLEQLPVITYDKLEAEGLSIKERIEAMHLDKIEVSEDTYKQVKKMRTEFTKEFKEYEAMRKHIKEGVNKPYADFEKAYNQYIKKQYEDADKLLKTQIVEVENTIKNRKLEHIEAYFNGANQFDFIKFSDLNIKPLLTDTTKKMVEKVDAFLTRISNDIAIINDNSEHKRIMARYVTNLDLSTSITEVTKEIEFEKRADEVVETAKEQLELIDETPTFEPTVPTIEPSAVALWNDEPVEEILEIVFDVKATATKIKKLMKFMKDEGIDYE